MFPGKARDSAAGRARAAADRKMLEGMVDVVSQARLFPARDDTDEKGRIGEKCNKNESGWVPCSYPPM